jgi:SAM-dependent methyltransferase
MDVGPQRGIRLGIFDGNYFEGSSGPRVRQINAISIARGVRDLKESLPDLFVCGVEPVVALVKQAVISGNTASGPILCGSGEALPFADASFDAVCEFAVLHHVANPNAVVKDMLRGAKKAVHIADSNRFGQSSYATSWFHPLLNSEGVLVCALKES